MKYDEELNNIIFKYKLDDGYPLFQKKYRRRNIYIG